jgi:hypothetical protein
MALSAARGDEAWAQAPDLSRPLSADPLVGWRIWRLERRDGALTLVSMTRALAWPHREAMRARCGRFERHAAPDLSCRCGIYATGSVATLARSGVFDVDTAVVGTAALWGTVVDHELGARAEFAYPARLRLVCGPCLAAGLGAVDPVSVVARGEVMLPRCERHLLHPEREEVHDPVPADRVREELLGAYAVEALPVERVARSLRRLRLLLRRGLCRAADGAAVVVRFTLLGLFYLFVAGCVLGLVLAALNRAAGR